MYCMLEELQNNLNILISAYETQKERADKAEKELKRCRARFEEANTKVKELEGNIGNLSLKNVFTSSSTDKTEAKARIDKLIKEIDTALALLK